MLVSALLLDLTHEVGGIVEAESHLVVVVAFRVIHGAGGVHLDSVLLHAAGGIVLSPPVDGDIAAGAETVVEIAVVGAEAGVGLLEVRTLDDTVVVEPAERH